jgi:hypothetical protein
MVSNTLLYVLGMSERTALDYWRGVSLLGTWYVSKYPSDNVIWDRPKSNSTSLACSHIV